MALMRAGSFTLHSGSSSSFLINADELGDDDLAALAELAVPALHPFGSVVGIPRGGLRFAAAFTKYITEGPRLVVDDVITTGTSFYEFGFAHPDKGVAIFNRGLRVPGVISIFTLDRRLVP